MQIFGKHQLVSHTHCNPMLWSLRRGEVSSEVVVLCRSRTKDRVVMMAVAGNLVVTKNHQNEVVLNLLRYRYSIRRIVQKGKKKWGATNMNRVFGKGEWHHKVREIYIRTSGRSDVRTAGRPSVRMAGRGRGSAAGRPSGRTPGRVPNDPPTPPRTILKRLLITMI